MSWYYALDKQQFGPIEQDALLNLFNEGQITQDTLVWQDGMADWQPLSTVTAQLHGASADPVAAQVLPKCPTCAAEVLPEYLIPYGDSHICPQCKDDRVQRLKEGAPVRANSELNRGTGGQSSMTDLYDEALATLKGQWGLAVGFTFLSFIIYSLPGMIPGIGPLFSLLCSGPIFVGCCGFWLNISRSEDAKISMMFDGFSIFGTTLGAYLMFYIIVMAYYFAALIPVGIIAAILFPVMDLDIESTAAILAIVAMVVIVMAVGLYGTFQHSQVFFIIADDPTIGIMESLKLSRSLMQGSMMKYFLLNLLFGILYIPAFLCFIFPALFLGAIHATTLANFYDDLQEPA